MDLPCFARDPAAFAAYLLRRRPAARPRPFPGQPLRLASFRRRFALAARRVWAVDWDGCGSPSYVTTWGPAQADEVAAAHAATDPDEAGFPDCRVSYRHECRVWVCSLGSATRDLWWARRHLGPDGYHSRVLHPDPGPCSARRGPDAHRWVTTPGSERGEGAGVVLQEVCQGCGATRWYNSAASDGIGLFPRYSYPIPREDD